MNEKTFARLLLDLNSEDYAKVEEEDDSLKEDPVITNEDFVLGIRPEFISISEGEKIDGEIYGAMPTGMETTVRIAIGNYIVTGVMFGGVVYKLGDKVKVGFKGDNVMLFDRKTGRRIAQGALEIG
mgnify:CR=1 FL=1